MDETEEYVIEYYETVENDDNTANNLSNVKVQSLKTPKIEKQSQLYTCYVKQEPTSIDDNTNLRSHYDNTEENINDSSSSFIQENINSETIVPETIVPDLENISLETRKRGRPKKKPLSILTPMEISNIHDKKKNDEILENNSEQLYAGFLGRTRRTTRQNQEDKEWSDESDSGESDSGRRGRRSFGSGKNRGKGRGKTRGTILTRGRRSQIDENAEVTVTFEEGDINQSIEIETVPSPSIPPKVYPNVKCGKCQEEFSKKEWNRHNLFKHNDTGWLDGNTPVDLSDDRLLKKLLTLAIKKRKGQLTCEKCGIQKRSAVGFLSHIRFCGKTDTEKLQLMIQCPRCNSKIKPTSMYTHERNCQKEKLNLSYDYQNDLEENLQCTSQGKLKRKAAQKAVSKISEFISAPVLQNEKINPNTIHNYIKKPHLKRKIGRAVRDAFQKELKETGIARCRQKCNYYGVTLEIICDHYTKCNFLPQENYVCKVCNMHSKIQKEIKDHVLEKHSTLDRFDFDPDHQLKNEDSSETSEDENENPKEKSLSTLRFIPDKPEEKLRAFRAVFIDRELVQNPKSNVPFYAAYRWTLEFEVDNYEFNLFKDLLPNEMKLLNNEEAEGYLPKLKRSMAIKYSNEARNEWNYFQRFEGKVKNEIPMFFVGGPIWALSWLPIPFKFYSQQPNQYLAISTHPKMESEYLMRQAYSEKNVIQIWNLRRLQQNNNELTIPELSYAIAHNGGTIWCMECCPSGCYQNPDYENTIDNIKRLGLLAAACSDGFVYIYSLPFPEQLEASNREKIEYPVYKMNPVQLLVVNIALNEKEKPTWQCTKLSWTKEKGHNILAAGFSNGYIALWNLTTQSSFLKKKQGSTTIVNSFRHFYAHHHSVSMLSIIPYGGKRFLASAGIDRYYKIWDLEQTNCMECMTTRGLAVDGSWLNNWPCSFLGYDDALGLSHTNSQLIPLREHSYKYFPILATNSPTYGIGVSDLANAIAQGSLAGEIVAIFPNQILYKDIENYLNKKRWLCSYVEVTDFKSSENPVEDQNKKDKKEYHYKPSTYDECSERFGITFSDQFKIFRTCKTRKLTYKVMPSDQMENVSIEQYPFASINRISWNPNAWSYLWFAAGYQNGFVRILNFNCVTKTDPIDKILPRFVEKFSQSERRDNDDNNSRHEENNENYQEQEEEDSNFQE